MKDRKVICLFCQHNSIPRTPLQTSQRWKTYPTRHEREPYVLPRLVIDLDAADNPHVKNYDDLPPDEQKGNLNEGKIRKVSTIVEGPDRALRDRIKPSWYKFGLNKNRPSPIELISYVLEGENDTSLNGKISRGKVQNRIKLSPQEGILGKVQELASTYIMDDEIRLKKAGFKLTKENTEEIRATLEECYDLAKLQLIISILSSTKEGCECLVGMGDAIGESIRLCRLQQSQAPFLKVSTSEILQMLNNLHLSMKSKGVEFGSSLSNRALYYAAKVGSLPAVKMYLEIAQKYSYDANYFGSEAPSELIISSLERDSRSDPTSLRSQAHRKDLLILLTGYDDGLPQEGVEGEPSFRSTFGDSQISHNFAVYRKYIFAIAQLGLGDTLWAEWQSALGITHKVHKFEKFQIQRAHFFALAFSIAGDSNRALEALSTIPSRTPGSPEVPYTLTARSRYSRTLRSLIYDHYRALNLSAEAKFWERVTRDLARVPDDAQAALDLMQRYLLLDYERGVQLRKVVIRELQEGGTGEMLMVWPLKEGAPLFAKELIRNTASRGVVDGQAEYTDVSDDYDNLQERHS